VTAPGTAAGTGIDVAAVLERCLDAVVDHHAAQGWPLPRDRYVAAGSPNEVAVDGEHLAVMLDGLTPGANAGSQRSAVAQSRVVGAVIIPRATLVLRLMRCVPTVDDQGHPPSVAALHAAGLDLAADVGRVLAALYAWRQTETVPASRNAQVELGQVEAIGPGGGLAGHLFFFTISPVQ
jgi:hypothetical protein